MIQNFDRSCDSGCLSGQTWRFGRLVPASVYSYGGLWNTDASAACDLKRREDKSLGLTYRGLRNKEPQSPAWRREKKGEEEERLREIRLNEPFPEVNENGGSEASESKTIPKQSRD